MAEDLDDGEFWLPSSFLSDDVAFDEDKASGELFPCTSLAPSPVGSVVSSTESDEEDFVAGLTQLLARAALDAKDAVRKRVQPAARSPQSTLCSMGSWSGRSLHSNTSPGNNCNGTSLGLSPPSTPLGQKENSLEALYAAAAQAVSITLKENEPMPHGCGLPFAPSEPFAVRTSKPWAPPKSVDSARLPAVKGCRNDMGRDFIALRVRTQERQEPKNWAFPANIPATHQVRCFSGGSANVKDIRTAGLLPPPLSPAQRVSANNGMRAVFLSDASTRRESTGTGVFLPRRVVHPSDHTRNKTGCSTVLLPARVVQALNLNIERVVGATQTSDCLGNLVRDQHVFADLTMNLDARSFAFPMNGFQYPQHRRRPFRWEPPPSPVRSALRLPQEWTY